MGHYPLFVNLHNTRCLVVGAGAVGLRKVTTLLHYDPAKVLVLDIAPLGKDWAVFAADARFSFEQRAFCRDDVQGCSLVFAATSDRNVNAQVFAAANEARIWCNVADDPKKSDFFVPSSAKVGSLEMAISTQGTSPALARRLCHEWQDFIGARYAPLAEVLARLRPMLVPAIHGQQKHSQAERTALFRNIVDSVLAEALATKDQHACRALLEQLLPKELHGRIGELLDGFV